MATESALTQSVRLYGLPGHIPTLWHSKGITDGLLAINVLGKKTSKWKFYLFGLKTDKQKAKQEPQILGQVQTEPWIEALKVRGYSMNLSDFGLKVLG